MSQEVITYGKISKTLNIFESLALDATFNFKDTAVDSANGVTTVCSIDSDFQLTRISTSVTRQLGERGKLNDRQAAQLAVKAFVLLLRELEVREVRMYPQDYSQEVDYLRNQFVDSEIAS